MERKRGNGYNQIVSSILSVAFSIIGISNITLSLWWHYLVAAIVVLFIFISLNSLFFCCQWIYIRFSRPKIGFDNEREMKKLLVDLSELETSLGVYHSSSEHYKAILIFQINKKLNDIDVAIEHIKSGNSQYMPVKSHSKYNEDLMATIEVYIASIKEESQRKHEPRMSVQRKDA